jgi:hypothetical protein
MRSHSGVALVAVLYFLVIAALTSIAVVFGVHAAERRVADTRADGALVAAADVGVHGTLATWNASERDAQRVGTTIELRPQTANGIAVTLWVTRLGSSTFSLVADAHGAAGPARRVALLVRVPFNRPRVTAALTSAVDLSIADGVAIVANDGSCIDTVAHAIEVAPLVNVTFDPSLPANQRPLVTVDSSAADSASYLHPGDWSWDELVHRADIRLGADAVLSPAPIVDGGVCRADTTNWGAPTDSASACFGHAPVVYAPGDLTIGGGVGQGVLLVDGRLRITGPFTFSGQIVVRRGLETHADAISISGAVYAWRAPSDSTQTRASRSDVVLAHGTSLRGSRCDAAHGMTSLLQPRAVRAHAWTELF